MSTWTRKEPLQSGQITCRGDIVMLVQMNGHKHKHVGISMIEND